MRRSLLVLVLTASLTIGLGATSQTASAAPSCAVSAQAPFVALNRTVVTRFNFWNCVDVKRILINNPYQQPPSTGFVDQTSCNAGGGCYANASPGNYSSSRFYPSGTYGLIQVGPSPVGPGGAFVYYGNYCWWSGATRQIGSFATYQFQSSIPPYGYTQWYAVWSAQTGVEC